MSRVQGSYKGGPALGRSRTPRQTTVSTPRRTMVSASPRVDTVRRPIQSVRPVSVVRTKSPARASYKQQPLQPVRARDDYDRKDRAPEDRAVIPTQEKLARYAWAQKVRQNGFAAHDPITHGVLLLEGVNFSRVEAVRESERMEEFKHAVKSDIVSEVGNGVQPEDVAVAFYPGQIKNVVLHYGNERSRVATQEAGRPNPELVDAEWSIKVEYMIRSRDVQRQQNCAMAMYTALTSNDMLGEQTRHAYKRIIDPLCDMYEVRFVRAGKSPADAAPQANPQQQQLQQLQRFVQPSPAGLLAAPARHDLSQSAPMPTFVDAEPAMPLQVPMPTPAHIPAPTLMQSAALSMPAPMMQSTALPMTSAYPTHASASAAPQSTVYPAAQRVTYELAETEAMSNHTMSGSHAAPRLVQSSIMPFHVGGGGYVSPTPPPQDSTVFDHGSAAAPRAEHVSVAPRPFVHASWATSAPAEDGRTAPVPSQFSSQQTTHPAGPAAAHASGVTRTPGKLAAPTPSTTYPLRSIQQTVSMPTMSVPAARREDAESMPPSRPGSRAAGRASQDGGSVPRSAASVATPNAAELLEQDRQLQTLQNEIGAQRSSIRDMLSHQSAGYGKEPASVPPASAWNQPTSYPTKEF